MSERVAVMYLGKIVEMAAAQELYKNPRHPYTRALLSAAPRRDPKAGPTRERIRLSGDVPSPIWPPSGCPFYARCPHLGKDEECRNVVPVLEEKEPSHLAACCKAPHGGGRGLTGLSGTGSFGFLKIKICRLQGRPRNVDRTFCWRSFWSV